MNDELSGKLTEILGAMQTAVGQAKDFTLSQLPDVVQSYVIYGRVWSIVSIVLLIGFIVACVMIGRWLYKNPWRGDFGEARGISNMALMIVSGVMIFISSMILIGALKGAALVWFAPKVWLMMELGKLIAGR